MLVLTRKIAKKNATWEDNSKFVMDTSDGRIEITVARANTGEVRLFIEAPKKVTITRKEKLKNDL